MAYIDQPIKRSIIEKRPYKADKKFGSYPEERPTSELIKSGIIIINKPAGPTSHQVSAYVQDILKINKSGHSGTLDPGVTGILPVAIERATRIVQALLPAGKEYVCLMHIHKPVDETLLRDSLNQLVGTITQLPPIKSAVKREKRQRKIYYIEILEVDGQDVLFKVGCQAGTYIRKFCHDFGVKLGTGAHMAELRRTKAGPFDETTMVTLQDLADAFHYYTTENNDKYLRKCIQPIENAIVHIARIWVMDTTVDSLTHGAELKVPGITSVESDINKGDPVAIMTLKNELVCLGNATMSSEEMLKAEKGICVRTTKVFMLSGIYPKLAKFIE